MYGKKILGAIRSTFLIKDGKISGDDISFTAERPFGSFAYTGKLSGDEIKFKVAFNDQNFEMTAKKVSK